MSKAHFGSLPSQYSFFLNPYSDVRFSRCPKCRRLTNVRKFALLIHIDPRGLFALRKTSRYCPVCELIVVHQDELESQLVPLLIIDLVFSKAQCSFPIAQSQTQTQEHFLETALATILSQQDPSRVGKPYFVIGCFKMKAWKAGMQTPLGFEDIRKYTADFKYQLNFTPALV